MSHLRIVRPNKAWQDKFRAYKILVDDREVGEIKEQGELVVPVAPGGHAVQLKIDWCCSPRVDVQVPKDSTTLVSCGPNFHPLLAIFSISVLRKKYIRIGVASSAA